MKKIKFNIPKNFWNPIPKRVKLSEESIHYLYQLTQLRLLREHMDEPIKRLKERLKYQYEKPFTSKLKNKK